MNFIQGELQCTLIHLEFSAGFLAHHSWSVLPVQLLTSKPATGPLFCNKGLPGPYIYIGLARTVYIHRI